MINDRRRRVVLKTYRLIDFICSRSCCFLSFLGPPTMIAYFSVLTGSTEVHDQLKSMVREI